MLTDAKVRAAKPREAAYKLGDSRGLYLYVTPAGAKSWRFKYRWEDKERRLTFGLYPDVSLSQARDRRDEARKMMAAGNDPAGERQRKEAERAANAVNTFEAVARRWHRNQAPTWSPKHAANVLKSLEEDAFPAIGSELVRDVNARTVLRVVQRVEERGAIDQAHRLRQRISAVFVQAIAEDLIDNNPATSITPAMKPLNIGRQPALTYLSGLREMLALIEGGTARPVTKLAHRLKALTVLRSDTLRNTPWSEIDAVGEDGLWRIPAQRMKLKQARKGDAANDHWVPLSRQAREILDAIRPLTGRGPLVFPSRNNAHRPVSDAALGTALMRAGYRGEHVPHGWRTSFSTIMNERFPEDRQIIDLMLAHAPRNRVESIYNRALYLDRRRELAQLWADILLDGMPPAAALMGGAQSDDHEGVRG